MPLSKISSIKGFGIFSDFQWSASTNNFKKKNLIYGWNYSGKTTFSKLFGNLEKKSKHHFPHSEYNFQIEHDNQTFDHNTLSTFPYPVKVFNSHYIRHVFSWETDNENGFEPIMFYLGDEAGDIQPKIQSLRDRWNPKIEDIIKNQKTTIDTFDEYAKESGKFSRQATNIRRYLNDQVKINEFNKGHIVTFISNLTGEPEVHLIASHKIEEIKKKAIALKEFSKENEKLIFTENLDQIYQKVKEVLAEAATNMESFPEIEKDLKVFNWVQTGLDLHQHDENCKFCGNVLSTLRIEGLNRYYSTKLKEIQDSIKSIRLSIDTDKKLSAISFVHESKIASHLREKYSQALSKFQTKINEYIKLLKIFEEDLKTKESNYFVAIEPTNLSVITTAPELQDIIDIILSHNTFVENFDKEKSDATSHILKHYTAEYLISEDYLRKKNICEESKILVERCKRKLLSNNQTIANLSALLKDTLKGKEELNIYLKIFLNRDDILIDVANDKYILRRGIDEASNLSEGEKTAIAFSYFLTELKSLKQEDTLKNTIIFFDDPISSLDSNHIFQVRSLIQHFFLKESDYRQLFISTHNFEFFSVLLDSNLFKNFNRQDIQETKCPFYLIVRTSDGSSVIKNLPKSLRSHKSEYSHIFHILKDYNDLVDKETFEFQLLLPNALRRFLELYSLFKFPKGFSEVDERLKMIFSPDGVIFHNTKLYHWFSHENQFEKVISHDAKLVLIDDAISEIMEHIKTRDQMHWQGLTGEAAA